MIQDRKIDLALEAKELAEGSAAQTTRLAGVKAQEDTVFGYPLTRVEILNREGEAALGKPKGTYLTLELPQLPREREEVLRAARGVAAVLEALPTLPKQGSVLVAGLGNRRVTPDAIGPRATDFLLVTRHLVQTMPQDFSALRPVSALAAGVTGTTGIESGELIGAVVKKLKPACLIAVDALAAGRSGCAGRSRSLTPALSPAPGWATPEWPWMRNTWGFPSSPWVYPRWWRRPPSAWTCWTRRGRRDSTRPSSVRRGPSGLSPPETWTARWRPSPGCWAWASAPRCMWTFPWKMWKSGSHKSHFSLFSGENLEKTKRFSPISQEIGENLSFHPFHQREASPPHSSTKASSASKSPWG